MRLVSRPSARRSAINRQANLATLRRPVRSAIEALETRLLMSTNSWKAAVSGSWDDATKWSAGHVPLGTEDVAITVAGSYSVTAGGANDVAHNVTLAKPLSISNGAVLGISGNLTLNSTLTVASSGVLTQLNFVDGAAGGPSLTGTGSIVMSGTSSSTNRLLYQAIYGHTMTIAAGITISGGGEILENYGGPGFTNLGKVTANVAGQTLTIDGQGLFTNKGTLSATGGGTLTLNGQVTSSGTINETNSTLNLGGTNFSLGNVTRTGGTINLTGIYDLKGGTLAFTAATGSWNLLGGTVLNGTLTFAGGSSLLLPASGTGTFNAVTLAGDLTIQNAYALTVNTTLTLAGGHVLTLASSGSLTQLNFNDGPTTGPTLGGAGKIVLAGTSPVSNRLLYQAIYGHGMTVAAGVTISGGGEILANYGGPGFNNFGTVTANVAGQTLIIDGQGLFTNKGTLSATGGGTLTLNGQVTNSALINETSSTINLGGTINALGNVTRTGGTINITGIYDLKGGTLAFTAATGSWNLMGGTLQNATLSFIPGASLLLPSGGTGTFSAVTLASDLTIQNSYALTVNKSLTINIGHTLTLASSGSLTQLNFNDGPTVGPILSGPGTVVLGGTSPASNRLLYQAIYGHTMNIAAGANITGAGEMLANYGGPGFTNSGTITANISGKALTIDGQGLFTNKGTFSATGGGTLTLNAILVNQAAINETNSTINLGGTINALGTVTRTGGTINVTGLCNLQGGTLTFTAATGSWNLLGGTLQNGTLAFTGTASLLLPSGGTGSFNAITLASNLTIQNSYALTVYTSLNLAGTTLTLASSGSLTQLNFTDGATAGPTLAGTGSVVLGGTAPINNRLLYQAIYGHGMTIAAGVVISGVGELLANYGGPGFNNFGTIASSTSGQTLTIDGAGVFTNHGTLSVGSGATLAINVTNWSNAADGVITGTGKIVGSVSNAGVIAPGAPFGTLTINGALTQTATGSIKVQLGGTAASSYNKLVVTGAAQLDGILDIYTLNGFHPALNNTFNVLSYANKAGTLGTDGSSFGPLALTATVGSTSTSLKVISVASDTTVPTVAAYTPGSVAVGAALYKFSVTFADNVAISESTLGAGNAKVTGPAGFTAAATLVGVSKANNGTPRTATYQIVPPGGTWDSADNGAYTVTLNSNSVKDTQGNAVVGKVLGTFTVALPQIPHLAFSALPATVVAGKAIAPSVIVKILDKNGSVITTDNSKVTIAIATGPTGAALTGTVSVNAKNGVATFANLILTKSGSYTFKATDGSDTPAASGTLNVAAAAATKLVFTQFPATAKVGVALAPAIKVTVEDTFGNVCLTNTSTVTIATSTAPAGGAVSGTLAKAAVAGVATFSDLKLSKAGSYKLKATDGSLTLAISTALTVS